MRVKNFRDKDLIKCLKKLGFTRSPQTGSSHLKMIPPKGCKITNSRPFIIVIQKRKEYDPITQNNYIKQIKDFGFKENDIRKGFK